jgi:hypothetical protein
MRSIGIVCGVYIREFHRFIVLLLYRIHYKCNKLSIWIHYLNVVQREPNMEINFMIW